MTQTVLLFLIITLPSGLSHTMAMEPNQMIQLDPIGTSYCYHRETVYYVMHNQTSSNFFVPANGFFIYFENSTSIKAFHTEETTADFLHTPMYEWVGRPMAYMAFKVPDADLVSFTPLNANYAADQNNAFYRDTKIPEADAKTIKSIPNSGDYALDSKHVFYQGRLLPKAKPTGFEVMANGYAKDKSRVYYLGRPIQKADAATFEIMIPPRQSSNGQPYDARDKNHDYFNGERVN